MKIMKRIDGFYLGLVFLFAAAGLAAGAGSEDELAAALAPLRAYEYGQSRNVPDVLDRLVRESYGKPPRRARLESALAGLLEADVTLAAKQEICRRLAIMGTGQSVPALARMLAGEDPRVAEAAGYALNANPSPAATAALREALTKAKGAGLVAVINLLGHRRDAASDRALADIAKRATDQVGAAAITALGKLATDPALHALRELRASGNALRQRTATLALLQAGRELASRGQALQARAIYAELSRPAEPPQVRRGALVGRLDLGGADAAEVIVSVLQGDEATLKPTAIAAIGSSKEASLARTFAARLPALKTPEQVLLIGALATSSEPAVRSALMAAAEHSALPARVAALQALGTVGDASAVPLLANKAGSAVPEEVKAATGALRLLKGPGVDQAVLEAIQRAPAEVRGQLIPVLADRNAAYAVPALLAQAAQPDERVCGPAFRALGTLAGEQDFPALLRVLTKLPVENARADAESALAQVAARSADPARPVDALVNEIKAAQAAPLKGSLVRVLAAIANENAFAAVAAALRDADPSVSDAALRALSNWPDTQPLPVLLEAATSNRPDLQRTIALRGYLRLLRETKGPAEDLARRYGEVASLARQPEDQRLLLSGLAAVPHGQALKLAEKLLDEPPVRPEAELAVLALARQLGPAAAEAVNAALEKVMASTTDPGRRAAAKALRRAPLFDGRTFAGWEGDTNKTWRIEDGALVAGSLAVTVPRNEFLATTREYENFELQLKYRLAGTEGFVNGGAQFRSQRIPNHHEVSGYQADLGAGCDGALYDESRRNRNLVPPSKALLERVLKPGDWNEYRIRAEGRRIRLWLNGVLTADYTEMDPAIPTRGIIALQIHGGAKALVRYRDIYLTELP
jgi:HEAT repeat protein